MAKAVFPVGMGRAGPLVTLFAILDAADRKARRAFSREEEKKDPLSEWPTTAYEKQRRYSSA